MAHGAIIRSHVSRIVLLISCPNEQNGTVKSKFIKRKMNVLINFRYCCDTNVPGSSVHTLPPSQSIKLECKYPYQFPNGSRYMFVIDLKYSADVTVSKHVNPTQHGRQDQILVAAKCRHLTALSTTIWLASNVSAYHRVTKYIHESNIIPKCSVYGDTTMGLGRFLMSKRRHASRHAKNTQNVGYHFVRVEETRQSKSTATVNVKPA